MSNAAGPKHELFELARAHVGELTGAETKLLLAAPNGEWAHCGPTPDDADPANDPARAETWGPDRVVRAALLRWMCVDSDAKTKVDPRGIQLHGAIIYAPLDLSFSVVPFPLGLSRCRFTHPANLSYAEIPALGLSGCWVVMLLAERLVTRGDALLRHGFHALGPVRLFGARVGGDLSCVGGTFHNPAQDGVNLAGMALEAGRITVKGRLLLAEEFRAEGMVVLNGAQIEGDFSCVGGTLHNPAQEGVEGTGTALNADGISVGGSVFFAGGFRADGEIRMLGGAHIKGQFLCVGGSFHNLAQANLAESGVALSADGIAVDGGIFLSRDFHAEGEVRLLGAKVGANLECVGGTFYNPPQKGLANSGSALNAKAIQVVANLYLNDGFRADGEVRLAGAQIGGDFQCAGAALHNPPEEDIEGSGTSLRADGLTVKGDVFLGDGFRSEGEVRLIGARIGGDLGCFNGYFNNPALDKVERAGRALRADAVEVGGDVNLNDGFCAEGAVVLTGARIGGDLSCGGGSFSNPVQSASIDSLGALHADRAEVKGGILLNHGFSADGDVRLAGAKIGMHLECIGAQFHKLVAENISVGKILWWQEIRDPAKVTLNLTNATVDAIVDDRQSWPERGRLYLDGFVYGRFPIPPESPQERLEWLRRVEPFTPQPYHQLATVFREAGNDRWGRDVLYAMEDRIWKEDGRLGARLGRWILWAAVGYGYRPLRAAWCLLLLTLLGFGLYRTANLAGQIVPTDEKAFLSFRNSNGRAPEHYPRFVPIVYSLESSVPLIKLGQVDHWQPNPSPQPLTWSGPVWYLRLRNFITVGEFLIYFRFVQIVAGWLLATLFLAGVTGLVRRS